MTDSEILSIARSVRREVNFRLESETKSTHSTGEDADLEVVRIGRADFVVDEVHVVAEDFGDISRVCRSHDELCSGSVGPHARDRGAQRTSTATPLRILTLRWRTSRFPKHSFSVAMAMTCGIAQKLKTLWFLSKLR